jgi:hypothetical protein
MRQLTLLALLVISSTAFCQTHKYYLENGILTASQVGSGTYLLKIDSKKGERRLQFTYNKMEGDVYIYELVKVDKETLTEYQRSISYLKTRTKFSDLCTGKGGELFMKILGESEIIQLQGK